MDPRQIHDNFTVNARGTRALEEAHDLMRELMHNFPERAQAVRKLRTQMQAAWTGAAADEAQQSAEPLERALNTAADHLSTAQDLLGRQIASFHQAANSVVPMPSTPALTDPFLATLTGDPGIEGATFLYLGTAAHNVDVYHTYYVASEYNSTNMPISYGDLTDDRRMIQVAVQHVDAAPGSRHDAGPAPAVTAPAVQAADVAGRSASSAAGRTSPSDLTTSKEMSTSVGATGASTAGGATPGATRPRTTDENPEVGPQDAPSDRLVPSSAGGSGLPAGVTARDDRVSPSVPSAGNNPAGNNGVPPPAVERIVAGPAVEIPGPERLGSTGVAAGPIAAPAAGRDKRAEDREHRAAGYLRAANPNITFGTDEKVAPPVIGE